MPRLPFPPLFLAALLVTCGFVQPASAAPVTVAPRSGVAGIWRATWAASGGVPVSIWLTLDTDGSAVAGTVRMTWGPEVIKQGRVDGDRLHLAFGNPVVPITLDGRLAGGRLRLTLTEPRRAPLALVAVRVAAVPAPLPRRPLPPMRDVPQAQVAATPPMGWSSWNLFNERIDDRTVRAIADALVASGLHDAGYRYVNIDDGWAGGRGRDGLIRANPKFPDMKALADYVHARGLKLGIYTSPGPTTCGGYPASYGHIAADMRQFADWGMDYVKVDWCTANDTYTFDDMRSVYQQVGEAIASSGRPMVFDVCQYGIGAASRRWGLCPKADAERAVGA